ncbi:MAG: CotH kinase family protein [Aristaeellaceae bacterium]
MKHLPYALALAAILVLLAGCAMADTQMDATSMLAFRKETPMEGNIHDLPSLYEGHDPTSVISMYLTVSSGNAADSSDHTWTEVSTYSTYYYEELGIPRYKVEGILQIDDGSGLGEGSYGWGETVPNVTVQVRGQTSSTSTSKNYKIRIKAGKEAYNGQRTLALNKHVTDPFRFLNKMCYDLLADIPQLVSARTQFVHLYVRDTTAGGSGDYVDYGLYTMVEQINRTYLKNHGLDDRGKLYKVNMFEWLPYDEIMAVGDDYDEEAFESYLEIKGLDDHADLRSVLTKLQNYSIPITKIMDEHFDAENICYWMAFQILIGNYDAGSRNAYLYSPLNAQKWYFISWDMDASFRRHYFEHIGYQEGQSWEQGMTQYVGLTLINRMMKEECYRQQLDDAVHDLMATALHPDSIAQRVKTYSAVVKQDIYQNPFSQPVSGLSPEEYDQYVNLLASEIQRNYESYQESLMRSWPFYVNLPEHNGDKLFLSWATSYDVHGESVTYAWQLAADYGFEDILAQGSGLTAPYVSVDALPTGTYYLKVTATNESGYTADCFDYLSVSGIGKVYGCYQFSVLEDGSIIYGIKEEG